MTLFDLIKDPYYKHKYVLERICMHLLGYAREELMLHYDDQIDDKEILLQIKSLYNEYAIGKQPLEYILGYVEYGGLRFHVNRNTIIPRPETEYMIEGVREYLTELKVKSGKLKVDGVVVVDVGTGSGVLGLSILHSHGSQIESAFLIDISKGALEVARGNYTHCLTEGQIDPTIDVVIEDGNLFSSPSLDSRLLSTSPGKKEIIILANLPYIPDETFDTNPDQSIKFEPRVAFVGGDDGLDLYRVMFNQVKSYQLSGAQQSEVTISSIDTDKRSTLLRRIYLQEVEMTNPLIMFLEMMTWQVDILRKEFDRLVFEEIKTFHFQIRIVKVACKVHKVEGL